MGPPILHVVQRFSKSRRCASGYGPWSYVAAGPWSVSRDLLAEDCLYSGVAEQVLLTLAVTGHSALSSRTLVD
jgi:hypothetical protein